MQHIKRFVIAALAALCAVGLALSKDDEGQRDSVENLLQVPSCPIRLPSPPLQFYLRINLNSIQSASPHPPPPSLRAQRSLLLESSGDYEPALVLLQQVTRAPQPLCL